MKKTIKIIIYTLVSVFTVLLISYKSILGAFGLGLESIETLKQLRHSEKSVQKMRQVHAEKKKRIKGKYLKRSKRRLASASAGFIPIVGTVVVAGSVVKFSLDDYCEDQKALIEEENLLFDTNVPYDREQCRKSVRNDFYQLMADTGRSLD